MACIFLYFSPFNFTIEVYIEPVRGVTLWLVDPVGAPRRPGTEEDKAAEKEEAGEERSRAERGRDRG